MTKYSIILAIVLFSCKKAINTNKIDSINNTSETPKVIAVESAEQDKIQLIELTKNLYEWVENGGAVYDYKPLDGNNDIYQGLDLEKHTQRVHQLVETNLFSKEFIKNYNKIGLEIDKRIKSKKYEWYVGELPPFGNDANPWCLCQDSPDKYWLELNISEYHIYEHEAVFFWDWEGKTLKYKIKASKSNKQWSISYLQGFDYDTFL